MSSSPDLSENAADAVAGGEPASLPTALDLAHGFAITLLHSSAVARASISYAAELSRIALGRSDVAPASSDWRFKDPTWSRNPVYRRVAQAYLAACDGVGQVIDDVEASGLDKQAQRARFATGIVTSALAPTNTLLGNPAAIKRVLETGGTSLARGMRNWSTDLAVNGGMPSTVKRGSLKVGEDLALTPGAVVDRDEFAELIQYAPVTDAVQSRPTLVVPPPIGRYYFLDLRPGRSFVEHAVSRGLQTFILSWRNPSAEQSDWDIDAYAERIITAVDVIREVTGSDDVNVVGFCAGGVLNTAVLNHFAATGDDRIHAAAYAVTLLDFGQSAPLSAFTSARLLSLVRRRSTKAGIIDARSMGSAFVWMRPNDLVWNYWVNNYLMGEDPPVFDILAWNADGTNLPAALHKQFLDIFQYNLLVRPGSTRALGSPVDLGQIKVPTYVTGAVSDHLTPWKSCYRTTQLLAGESTFALSNAGHIASLVNPPGNPKASYFTGPSDPRKSPDEWLASAEKTAGSWWEHWAEWSLERSGEQVPAPRALGSSRHPVLGPAPGTYVTRRN